VILPASYPLVLLDVSSQQGLEHFIGAVHSNVVESACICRDWRVKGIDVYILQFVGACISSNNASLLMACISVVSM